MQFTVNTIIASVALFSAISLAAPLQDANSSVTAPSRPILLKFIGDGNEQTITVTLDTPTVFRSSSVRDITSITIAASFGFCTIWDNSKDNKRLGQAILTEDNFNAGIPSKPLTFSTPVQVGSFFCSTNVNKIPEIPNELLAAGPTRANSTVVAAASAPNALPVTAPVATQGLSVITGSPLILATEWPSIIIAESITLQITGPSGVTILVRVSITGRLTEIPRIQNVVSIAIFDDTNAACTFYGPKLVVFGQSTQFNGERTPATFPVGQVPTEVPFVQCIPKLVSLGPVD
jgi:hypothetical protein